MHFNQSNAKGGGGKLKTVSHGDDKRYSHLITSGTFFPQVSIRKKLNKKHKELNLNTVNIRLYYYVLYPFLNS